jgi:hypothetical protein
LWNEAQGGAMKTRNASERLIEWLFVAALILAIFVQPLALAGERAAPSPVASGAPARLAVTLPAAAGSPARP